MKNSNNFQSENLKKCPYQCKVYATDNIDLIYVKSYRGDWGHWDDKPDHSYQDQSCIEKTVSESTGDADGMASI
ncbi:hypothetical protein [Flavobacterium sp.]|uniref:hypothetical protein n=1 Tax=Flavobacterium sp. TaxID=239 RepID=UPI003D10467D